MLNELDDTLSRTKADSEISKINKNAGSGKVTVDTSTYNLLKSCTEHSRLTDGDFDITLVDISDMWGFGKENPPMPDSDELKKLAGTHSYRNIEFDDENHAKLNHKSEGRKVVIFKRRLFSLSHRNRFKRDFLFS